MLDSPWLRSMDPIWGVLAGHAGDERVFSFTYVDYCKQFRETRRRLGVPILVPYAARHSGPSVDRALNLRTSEEVRKRGQWAQHRSMARYEKAGRLAATARSYTAELAAHLRLCEAHVEGVMVEGKLDALKPFVC